MTLLSREKPMATRMIMIIIVTQIKYIIIAVTQVKFKNNISSNKRGKKKIEKKLK